VPAWLRPYSALSTGEKFRADLARLLLSRRRRIVVDEFTGAKKGLVQVTANMFADVGVRYPKAFAFTNDILLT
jgi:ABC-type ATPase with predicted acetyltransferase domain